MQRKPGKLGKSLGKTTGWVHRQSLLKYGVNMIGGVSYDKIDEQGLHYTKDTKGHVFKCGSYSCLCWVKNQLANYLKYLDKNKIKIH